MTAGDRTVLDAAYVAALEWRDERQAAVFEAALEEYDRPPAATPAPGEAATWYAAALGLRVFPLAPGSKVPYPGSRGFKDATVDTGTVGTWWGAAPRSNVGVATGAPYDVIDVDGPDGDRSMTDMLRRAAQIGKWMDVRAVSQTPHGVHLWVPAVPGAHNTAYTNGVDYRADGGYVVAPPSHVDGTLYRWLATPPVGRFK